MTCWSPLTTLIPSKRFETAVAVILKHEGGLSNNPNDPGGITNFGISLRWLKSAGLDINCDGVIDAKDIEIINSTEADKLYYKYWWTPNHYEAINNLDVAIKLFDMAVNMGNQTSTKIAQNAVNSFIEIPIVVDGILGSATFSAINGLTNEDKGCVLLHKIRVLQINHYQSIVATHPVLRGFLNGWINRANDC